MRAVIQRVQRATVMVGGEQVSAIGNGFLVLLGVTHADGKREAEVLARKIGNLRVFEDADGRMNLSLGESNGAVLAVSQFTLYADVRKGRRPSFTDAARPEQAEPLYRYFCSCLAGQGLAVGEGVFGAHMQIELVNDGPVTLIVDSEQLSAP